MKTTTGATSQVAAHLLWTVLVLAAAACGSGGSVVQVPDLGQDQVDKADSVIDLVPDLPPHEVAAEVELDLLETPDAEVVERACAPGEGCFLDKCQENGTCVSGWCVEHMGDGVCTTTCTEECPQGWTCRLLAGTGADPVYVCISDFANLCKPCATAADCKSPGGAESACVSYGDEGSFCGGACDNSGDCPWGFQCKEAKTVDGATILQCVAETGVCPCTAKSSAAGLSTPCSLANEFGECSGKRVCTQEGLSACSAEVPAEETCNGLDDDCDGDVDEGQLTGEEFIGVCEDGNECTKDTCLGEGGCGHEALDSGECKDGDACTVGDHCQQGECKGTPIGCDDGNPCTDDTCDGLGGCQYSFNLADCDDGDPCSVADECQEGKCKGVTVPCDCQSDEDCMALEDGDVCNGTLQCDKSVFPYQCAVEPGSVVACELPAGADPYCNQPSCDPKTGKCGVVPDHEGLACSDSNACTLGDQCQQGSCTGSGSLACDDGNLCTDDSCDAGLGCQHKANSLPCDDGSACTLGDQCSAGKCVSAGFADCDDSNPCTKDGCDSKSGCTHAPAAGPCSDGNPCTVGDQCDKGLCKPGPAADCDDGNPCTSDSCGDAGLCLHSALAGACDDGNACTTGDQCIQGKCVGGDPLLCDDADVCTSDWCDPKSGCVHKLNQAPCDDANVCTTGDHCHLGQCISSGKLTCADGNPCTDDSCDPKTGCSFLPNKAPCDDGNACTKEDACGIGKCQPGVPVDCSDGNLCTDDSCDPAKGCLHSNNKAPCDDANACTGSEFCSGGVCGGGIAVVCNDNNGCTDDSCHPVDGCVYKPNIAVCDDANACTAGDVCADGKCKPGQAVTCDDTNVCTTDSCDAIKGCQYVPVADHTPCAVDKECIAGKCESACQHGTITFDYTGGAQIWTVPSCVTAVDLEVYGAQGGSNANTPPAPGPLGGKAAGKLAVTPGAKLHIYVGGSGDSGGWNGGGGINGGYQKGRGGGASDVRYGGTGLADRKIVAGGAGAHAPYSLGYGGWNQAEGGAGGGLNGAAGQASNGNPPPAGGGGGGGQTNGGAKGTDVGGNPSSEGTFGQGGLGGGEPDNDSCGAGGGGGGGWYGGGGGGHHNCGGGGGGGGSSYVGGVSNGDTQAGVRSGNGMVVIKY